MTCRKTSLTLDHFQKRMIGTGPGTKREQRATATAKTALVMARAL